MLKQTCKKNIIFFSSEKLDKGDSKADSSSSAKLVTLTKAIDSIQENSKSLESMGRENPKYVTCLLILKHFSEENEDRVCYSEGS